MIAAMLHHIRRTILDTLATTNSLRYSEIKPKDLDGNVFDYHLKGLIVDGLVQKSNEGDYSLTATGRNYIVHRYEDPTVTAHSIFLIVLRRGSEYLLRRRKVQPLVGYSGFIHGEPQAGVGVIQTAQERLREKTGPKVDLSVVGSALITQHQADELQSFSNAIIIYGQTDEESVIEGDETGSNFWATLDEAEKLLPSCVDIVGMIERREGWMERSYVVE